MLIYKSFDAAVTNSCSDISIISRSLVICLHIYVLFELNYHLSNCIMRNDCQKFWFLIVSTAVPTSDCGT